MSPDDPTAPGSPGRHLSTHRAPQGLLEASRRARRRPLITPLSFATLAAGLLLGALADHTLSARSASTEAAALAGARPVTIVHHAEGAGRVEVAGTFNDWTPSRTPLQPVGDGVFRGVLWLPPGQYEYQIVVDGQRWRPDPLALRQRDDGFGAVNSVLEL